MLGTTRAQLFLVCSLTACAATPSQSSSPPLPAAIVSASGNGSPSASSSAAKPECVVDADCKARLGSPDATPVCEAGRCEAWSVERLREWAKGAMPDLPSVVPPPPTLEAAKWIDRAKENVLHVDADELYPGERLARCVPVKLRWEEGALRGPVARKFGQNPTGNGVWSYTIALGLRVALTGPGMVEVTDAGERTTGIGELQELGHHLAWPVDDALRYRGWLVRKVVRCEPHDYERDRRCPSCVRCRLAIQEENLEPRTGRRITARPRMKTAEGDTPSCIACPAVDENERTVARFEPLTRPLLTLLDHEAGGPAFFREAQACERDRKARLAGDAK